MHSLALTSLTSLTPSTVVHRIATPSFVLPGDGISIPTALVVLCLTLKSSRYVLVPLLSIAASIPLR